MGKKDDGWIKITESTKIPSGIWFQVSGRLGCGYFDDKNGQGVGMYTSSLMFGTGWQIAGTGGLTELDQVTHYKPLGPDPDDRDYEKESLEAAWKGIDCLLKWWRALPLNKREELPIRGRFMSELKGIACERDTDNGQGE